MRKGLSERQQRERVRRIGLVPGSWEQVEITDQMRSDHPHLKHATHIYKNRRVEVTIWPCRSSIGGIQQVFVHRHMDLDELTWSELNRIVHELFGENALALEMFPPADVEFKTETKMRALFVMPLDYVPPFGLHLPTAFGNPEPQ